MKVRTFHVASMHEAIRSIKETLGPDAVILSTKRVRSWDNGFGLLGGSVLEVMAAIEDDASVPDAAPCLMTSSTPVPRHSRLRRSRRKNHVSGNAPGRYGAEA
ncbi:MAG: hypothetical protein MRJ92_05565 [Nitrospira sp.]|nr:hypothetical protein [Nitrospira sp.]